MNRLIRRIPQLAIILTLLVGVAGLAPAAAQGGDATVVPDTLNMRHGPGEQYAVIAQLTRGTGVSLLGRDVNGWWVLSRTGAGQEGWLATAYLDVRPDLDVMSLPYVEAPTDTGTPMDPGQPDVPAEPETPASGGGGVPEGTGFPAQTNATVNMRTGAGTGYAVITTLPGGVNVLAMGRNAAMDWVLVRSGGQDGWVYWEYVTLLSGYLSQLPISTAITTPGATAPAAEDGAAPADSGYIPAPISGGPGLSGFGYGGHVDSFAYPNLMAHAGMTWAKRQVRHTMGASGGAAAGAVAQAHGNGFKILLGVVGDPNCVVTPGCFEDYARFVGEVAAQGPDAIEVWNEMNIDREWANGNIDPAKYTQLLALSYNAIKSANPNVAVISGAPAPTGAEGAFGSAAVWNDDRYVRGMAAAGAASYMDCIGAHYNEGIVGPDSTGGDPRGGYYTRYFWGMVNTYSGAFGGARPVCFTELGYLSPEGLGPLPESFAWGSSTTVAEQAAWIARAVQLARSSGRVRLVIIWNIDFTNYSGDPMAGYAIVRPGGGCPACDALSRIG